MDRRLLKIKRLVNARRFELTFKAAQEGLIDGITEYDVVESILTAQFLRVKNSTSAMRKGKREKIYIIDSFNFEGVAIYSKGVIRRKGGHEEYYILISGKRSRGSD